MIGPITWCAIYSACLLAAGYGAIALIDLLTRAKSNPAPILKIERFGLAACLGPGIMGLILLAISFLGRLPQRETILAIGITGAIVAAVSALTHRTKTPRGPRMPKWLAALSLLIIGYGVVTVALDAFFYPSYEWDAFSVWQLKAKVLTLQPLVPRPAYFSDASMSYSVQRYPLLASMISAGVHAMTGDLSDELGQSPYFLMYLGLGAATFGLLRRARGPIVAILACGILMTIPSLLACAAAGTADFALTAFYGCSVLALLRWREYKSPADLVLAVLFSACMTWTKNEGSALAAINAVALFALCGNPFKKRELLATIAFILAVAILAIPRLLYIRGIPITTVDYLTQIRPAQMLANLNRLPAIFVALLTGPWIWRDFGLLAFLLTIAALLDIKNLFTGPKLFLWTLLVLHMLAYVAPFLVTQLNLPSLFPVTVPRLLVHVTPVAVLLLAWHWPAPAASPANQIE